MAPRAIDGARGCVGNSMGYGCCDLIFSNGLAKAKFASPSRIATRTSNLPISQSTDSMGYFQTPAIDADAYCTFSAVWANLTYFAEDKLGHGCAPFIAGAVMLIKWLGVNTLSRRASK